MLETLAIKFVSNCFSENACRVPARLPAECEECERKLDNWKLLLVTLHSTAVVAAAPKVVNGPQSKVHPGGQNRVESNKGEGGVAVG